jgi:hypothetical protein
MEDLIIDETNFEEYFHDVRKCRPMQGHIMAKYSAVAELIDGEGKKDILYLLKLNQAHAASAVMRKMYGAIEPDCYRVCREIVEDLMVMTEAEVLKKPYKFILEFFYYVKKEYVPKDDPHWQIIDLINFDDENR